ncbi:hypothetical protein EDC04DRAFT_2924366, partial [Pisolithus marmoratus]
KNGFITDPVVLSPTHTAVDVLDSKARLGFHGIPTTRSGCYDGKLHSIVTPRHSVRVSIHPSHEIMTTNLVTIPQGDILNKANIILCGCTATTVGTRPNGREWLHLLVEADLDVVVLESL